MAVSYRWHSGSAWTCILAKLGRGREPEELTMVDTPAKKVVIVCWCAGGSGTSWRQLIVCSCFEELTEDCIALSYAAPNSETANPSSQFLIGHY